MVRFKNTFQNNSCNGIRERRTVIHKTTIKHVNIGVIGCGYWGPKLVRNFSGLSTCRVKKVSDIKSGRLEYIKKEFPFIETTKNFREVIHDKSINAVCIATPVSTHKDLAEEAMFFGKHVFVEKPLAGNFEDAKSLVETSKKLNKKLAVGHVFQYAPAVRKIKSLLKAKAIGKISHITSTRINLPPTDSEIDVIWDLGPHDFSIILYLLEETPWKVSSFRDLPISKSDFPKSAAQKKKFIEMTNNAHIDLEFKNGITAHVHLSWLSSNKMRLMQIFGSEGTLVYDEMLALDGKLKLYGKGVDNRTRAKDADTVKLGYQTGEIQVMSLEQHEPLRMECEAFIDSILKGSTLINDGTIGLEVVKLLETSSESFKHSPY